MRVGSLFSGIGGLDLGLERAGMQVVWQCESDSYCRAVLRKHWPDVLCYEDVRDIDGSVPAVDVLCGGFPCQPVSQAGSRRGTADERWLWPEFARVIRLLRPAFVLVENVPGLLTANGGDAMGEVLGELAASGYDAEWDCIPAAAIGAPHRRDRVWIVAYPDGERYLHREAVRFTAEARKQAQRYAGAGGAVGTLRRSPRVFTALADAKGAGRPLGAIAELEQAVARPERRGCELRTERGRDDQWAVEPDVGRVAYGVPSRVDRLRTLGNAVVPQVAEWIGRRMMEVAMKHRAGASWNDEETECAAVCSCGWWNGPVKTEDEALELWADHMRMVG